MAPVDSNLTREMPLSPQRSPWDRDDSREGHAQGQPGAGYERKINTLSSE